MFLLVVVVIMDLVMDLMMILVMDPMVVLMMVLVVSGSMVRLGMSEVEMWELFQGGDSGTEESEGGEQHDDLPSDSVTVVPLKPRAEVNLRLSPSTFIACLLSLETDWSLLSIPVMTRESTQLPNINFQPVIFMIFLSFWCCVEVQFINLFTLFFFLLGQAYGINKTHFFLYFSVGSGNLIFPY